MANYKYPAYLTEEQSQALIRHYRAIWAKILKRERKTYREGLVNILLENETRDFSFIVKKTKTHLEKSGSGICFDSLRDLVKDLEQNLLPYQMEPKVSFSVVGDYGEEEPCVEVTTDSYVFKQLNHVKRLIHGCSIDNMLRDASWKLQHQPNSKDAKRYLNIIEHYSSKN